ncbi:MAG: L,D-transpeptidase [Syntrophobacteraceae bacterium]|nr:L,D-transpeptidase [Desulfobacteraceae bacterium]
MKRNALIVCFGLVVCVLALPSCCLFESSKDTTVVSIKPPPPPEPPKPADLPYSKINFDYPLASLNSPRIFVYKNQRRLLLIQDETLIRDYPVGLGPSPTGDKCYRGDGRTPEGEFFICSKNPNSNYYKSFGISYPDAKRAKDALIAGTISWNDYQNIVNTSSQHNTLPTWNTPLGGAIMIHGGGAYKDWTLGCIAVSNSIMDELFPVIPLGTPVKILP